MKNRRNDNFYITLKQAAQLTSRSPSGLRHHAHRGHLRARYLPHDGPGCPRLGLHIDDVQVLNWPTVRHLSRWSGISIYCLYQVLYTWRLPGLRRVGSRYYFAPGHVPAILEWLAAGRPVRPPFVPRETHDPAAEDA